MLLSVRPNAVHRTSVLEQHLPSTISGRRALSQGAVREALWGDSSSTTEFPLLPLGVQSDVFGLAAAPHPEEIDCLYLFARFLDWEQTEEPTAGWELLEAAKSSHADTGAHARALLASSRHLTTGASLGRSRRPPNKNVCSCTETDMDTPCGLEIVERCSECTAAGRGFFCKLSESTLEAWDEATHKSTLPAGAILFVEGQKPRGVFVICSGRVNLSTTSREGKLLLLRTADAGEAIGLSATIAGLGYEVTAETATACQVSFIDRTHVLELMETYSDFGVQCARCLSRGFHEAYRDIRDLMLSKTSAGKLARLLLSQSPSLELEGPEVRIPSPMTHEEMGHRIGASRETVTRLLTSLKRKRLIRQDGPTIVIPNRTALEALTT
jgi:CRP/FNR family cyclic AMP-dependent transcriptional regulator